MSFVIDLERDRREQPDPSLDALLALTSDDIKLVNQTIIDRMESPVILIPQLARHITAAGGKRMRPMLTLASAYLCGYHGQRHVRMAACVEFIHTATLLHDDVVDASDMRRGAASANAIWGNKSSVLVGDFLYSRAFELMLEEGDVEVSQIMSLASSVIAEGEVLQLITANNTETTETEYLEVIRCKTAKLFSAACEIGAVISGTPEPQRSALRAFGHNLGMAFQLVDDVLDYSAKQASLGKSVGDDFREGKITLPVVLAFRAADEEGKKFWRRTLEDLEQKKGDIRRAVTMLEQTGALAATMNRAREYASKARAVLDNFPSHECKTALLEAVAFTVGRSY